jgi:hypothetical protein
MKETAAVFSLNLSFIDGSDLASAGVPEDYKNPLLTFVQLVFTDDKPNANKQGIKQAEFGNLTKSMTYMPIKAKFDPEEGVAGHADASIVGVIKTGHHEGDKVVAIGALYRDEYPELIDYFKKQVADGNKVDFSWEVRYKDSEIDGEGVEWLKGTTTKAITAVRNPAYQGRTPLVAISAIDFVNQINQEITRRKKEGVLC